MMEAEEVRQTAPETTHEDDTGSKHEACVSEAWRLLGEGVYTFRAIARGVNEKTGCSHTHEWVKRALVKHGQMVADTLESGAIDARAKYLAALYARRATAASIANNGTKKDRDRIAALRLMTHCDEKIAAAEGVSTTKQTLQHEGGEKPVTINIVPFGGGDNATATNDD